jgi:hypothetical protein
MCVVVAVDEEDDDDEEEEEERVMGVDRVRDVSISRTVWTTLRRSAAKEMREKRRGLDDNDVVEEHERIEVLSL